MTTPTRSLARQLVHRHSLGPDASLRLEEFDVLVRELVPRIRLLLPDLSELEVLRAAARTAEYRLAGERTLVVDSLNGDA